MKSWLGQTIIVIVSALLASVIYYTIIGPPNRQFPCDQAVLAENHVCLKTVMDDWDGKVLWVDARSLGEYQKSHIIGALWLSESDVATLLSEPEMMERIGMSGVSGQKLVVYCGSDACGSSELVAGKIRETGFHSDVFVLQGGWRAITNDASPPPLQIN